jgi:hypothetical protein
MTTWLQHLLVLTLVLACATFVVWQTVRTLRGKGSRVGSCCAKGCGGGTEQMNQGQAQRVVFLPVETLRKTR